MCQHQNTTHSSRCPACDAEYLLKGSIQRGGELIAENERLRVVIKEIVDGLANIPNCPHDPDINIAVDALWTYADSIINPKPQA